MNASSQPFSIVIERLTHEYATLPQSRLTRALSDVSLRVGTGEYVAVIGSNGSGKTTLARHLNALLLPTSGDVVIAGWNTRKPEHLRAIRSEVGMVFQSPADQMVATVVEEDVAFGPENLGVASEELPVRVREALERVSMWDERGRPPHLLSPGQQQRVAIAGALAMNPRCLVLDEATAMLDPIGRSDLLELLDDLHCSGMTIVTITHSMEEAARAELVVVLNRGRLVRTGPPSTVLTNHSQLWSARLEPTPAAIVADRLRRAHSTLRSDILSSEDLAGALVEQGLGGSRSSQNHGISQNDSGSSATVESTAAQPLVQVMGLHHTYLKSTPLATLSLRGVDFTVCDGEAVALIGPTGSGKSTLLQHLNGIFLPQQGKVLVTGSEARAGMHDLSDPELDMGAIRRSVGLVFQRPENQLFERYVGDDIAYGPRMAGLRGDELRERVRWAMHLVGMDFERDKDRMVSTLSGGQRRKTALAGIIAIRPRILALDEPTAGLDPATRRELIERLLELKSRGQTLILATHNMDDVAILADRVMVLSEGRVVLHGSTRAVFSQADKLTALGLGFPSAVVISRALSQAGIQIDTTLLSLDELALAILKQLPDPDSRPEAET